MVCTTPDDEEYEYRVCGEFLFIDEILNYENSTALCNAHNHELAYINVESGEAVENELVKHSAVVAKSYYRIGLKFERKNGILSGMWVNGETYDTENNGEIEVSSPLVDPNCNEVLINRDMKTLVRVNCNVLHAALCRKKHTISNTAPSTGGTLKTTLDNGNSTNELHTSTVSSNQIEEGTTFIGISVAVAIVLIFLLVLLAYICYNRRKKSHKKDDRCEKEKSQNVPDAVEPGYQTVAEFNNNDATYMEVDENNKNTTEENEEIEEKGLTSDAVYTQVSKRKSSTETEKGDLNDSNDKNVPVVYTTVDKTKNKVGSQETKSDNEVTVIYTQIDKTKK